MGNYLNYFHEKVIRASLSELHTSGNLVQWFMHEELWLKRDYNTLLQYSLVWWFMYK